MAINKKLAGSDTWSKLLAVKFHSMNNAVMHGANAEIKQTIKDHDNTHSQMIFTILSECIQNAKDVQTESTNKCSSDYTNSINNGTLHADAAKTSNVCVAAANTAYDTSAAQCSTDHASAMTALAGEVDATLTHLFTV
jgi:hypothetical protein